MNKSLKTKTKKFLSQTFIVGALFSTSAFAFLRMMVYPLPIELAEDGLIFLKTVLTGWALVMLGKGAFEGLVFIGELVQKKLQNYTQSFVDKANIYKTTGFINQQYGHSRQRRGTIKIYNKATGISTTLVQE